MTQPIVNKYAGICECGITVPAGQGYYWYGRTHCALPDERNYCPIMQTRIAQHNADMQIRYRDWASRQTDDIVPEGACPKCKGNGKYFYSTGAVGVCYDCDGTGTC